jgi:hypothetical protein
MNIPDNFSESLETVFKIKKLKFFDADPDPGSRIVSTLDSGLKLERDESRIRITAKMTLSFNIPGATAGRSRHQKNPTPV